MGLCFASFLDPSEGPIPTAHHDVPMHWIVTEAGAIQCAPERYANPI
jgi:5-formyltetrahydrofolate cyclo-ligase